MAHAIGGFDLNFTSRTSWKAERRFRGLVLDVIPVTWTKGRRQDGDTKEVFQQVWFQDQEEMESAAASREPFIVAVARAKDYSKLPHAFDEFVAIFEVVATGVTLDEKSIETRVIRRIQAT